MLDKCKQNKAEVFDLIPEKVGLKVKSTEEDPEGHYKREKNNLWGRYKSHKVTCTRKIAAKYIKQILEMYIDLDKNEIIGDFIMLYSRIA